MLLLHFTCPGCTHRLHSGHALPAGTSIQCPRCGTRFRVAVAGAKEAGPGRGRDLLLARLLVLFFGVFLLGGGGMGLAILVSSKRAEPQASAEAPSEEGSAPRAPATPVDPPTIAPPARPEQAPASSPPAPAINLPENPPPAPDVPPPLPTPPPPPSERSVPARADPPAAPPPPQPQPRPPDPSPKPAKPAPPTARTEAPQIHWLTPHEQRLVDRAVDHGIVFLRRQQHADGTWGDQGGAADNRHTPGITALAALTLLECGVAPHDRQVQQAAHYLRAQVPDLTATYSLSLALLFFDRLGEKQDIPRIRTLALRLIAGQKPSGGWDYSTPRLTDDEELGLLALLHKDRPTSSLELFLAEMGKRPGLETVAADRNPNVSPGLSQASKNPKLEPDLYRPRRSAVPPLDLFIAQAPGPQAGMTSKTPTPAGPQANLPPPQPPEAPRPGPTLKAPAKETAAPAPTVKPSSPTISAGPDKLSAKALAAAAKLSEELRKTPALNSAILLRGRPNDLDPRTDNSNTQFAILGLLVAERYDVPLERVMALIDWRFRGTQVAPGGTWHYQTRVNTSPAMTGAGLLGLALKHGLLLPNPQNRGRHVLVCDPLIQTSFTAWSAELTRYFTRFVEEQTPLDKLDLYVLWTMERVAVLYDRRKIGNLEWYSLGVRLLLPLQQPNGSWSPAAMLALNEPAVSTSFALLFLKRSNLTRDLTQRLNPSAEK